MTAATRTRRRSQAPGTDSTPPEPVKVPEWSEILERALTTPGSIGKQYSRFYQYSLGNSIWLMIQGCPPEPVATYERWKGMGRQVKLGSKAKYILRPITVKDRSGAKDANGEPKKFQLFKPSKCIFALSETEGPDLPPLTEQVEDWNLGSARAALGVRLVEFDSTDGNTQGWSSMRNGEPVYAVNPIAEHPLKTALHELGHILCGHFEEGERPDHRGTGEFQAEATALLVAKELGVCSEQQEAESRGYIQHHLHTSKPTESDIRKVFTAADKILKAGRPEDTTEQEPQS
jgi:hypothetical protein